MVFLPFKVFLPESVFALGKYPDIVPEDDVHTLGVDLFQLGVEHRFYQLAVVNDELDEVIHHELVLLEHSRQVEQQLVVLGVDIDQQIGQRQLGHFQQTVLHFQQNLVHDAVALTLLAKSAFRREQLKRQSRQVLFSFHEQFLD